LQDCSTDFEFLPIDVSLERCQRYFQVFGTVTGCAIASGMSQTSTQSIFTVHYITNMRSAPTHTVNDLNITDNVDYGPAVTSITNTNASTSSSRLTLTHASGATIYRGAILRSSSTASTSRLTLDSEL